VVVLAQWNADAEGHIGLCKLLARLGISALRISLPYHDRRMPAEITRADYIVSSNVGRTLQVCRQAVMDVRRALWWLRDRGYSRLGLLGTSLGSCLAMLTGVHEPLVRAQALNHVSPYFGDVVWRGLSTEHVRRGLDGHVELDDLRELWRPISPWSYLERAGRADTLLVYAKYDLTFPVDLSKMLVDGWRRRDPAVTVATLPCGHYTTGEAPFKFLDGYYLGRFLRRRL
jgi:dienelactone hydrolase